MARFDITKQSAVNISKWRLRDVASAEPKLLKRMAITHAIEAGTVEEIVGEVYALGLCISADDENPQHQAWLKAGAIARK